MNYLDRERVRDILQREFTRHTQEMKEHKELAEETGSKKQKDKIIKHMHKRYQTGCIAKLIGFQICENCGRIY